MGFADIRLEDTDPTAHATLKIDIPMSHRIAIVTTKQPGTNPRMRKNADALTAAGYEVHVLYAYNAEWADIADETIFKNARWTHRRVGGHPKHDPSNYMITRIKDGGLDGLIISQVNSVLLWTNISKA